MSKRLMDMIMSQIGTCSRKGVPQCGFTRSGEAEPGPRRPATDVGSRRAVHGLKTRKAHEAGGARVYDALLVIA